MDQKEFAVVVALARSSMKHPNSAIVHHITRLKKMFEEKGELDRAESLGFILEVDPNIPKPRVILSES